MRRPRSWRSAGSVRASAGRHSASLRLSPRRSLRVGAARPERQQQAVKPRGTRAAAVPAAGTGPAGGPRRNRRPVDQCRESGGERTKPPCQTGSAAGIAICVGRETIDRKERRGGASNLRGESPRCPLGGTQQPEHDAADGPGAAGRLLGKAREREQQGDDAPKRVVMSVVCRITLHARVHAQEKAVCHGSARKERKIFLLWLQAYLRRSGTVASTNPRRFRNGNRLSLRPAGTTTARGTSTAAAGCVNAIGASGEKCPAGR